VVVLEKLTMLKTKRHLVVTTPLSNAVCATALYLSSAIESAMHRLLERRPDVYEAVLHASFSGVEVAGRIAKP
jgi:hypothetical protein